MQRRTRRAASLACLGLLALAFATAAAASLASDPCCTSMAAVDGAPCQSFAETQCCDTPLGLQQVAQPPALTCSGVVGPAWPAPAPALAPAGLRAPAASAAAVLLGSVVLRL